jgi:hypothetical protein
VPRQPQQGKSQGKKPWRKKEKKKEIGAPSTKSRGMMKMTCIVFLRPEMEGWRMCAGSSPHIPYSVRPRCGMVGVRGYDTTEYMWIYLDSWSNSHLPHDVSTTKTAHPHTDVHHTQRNPSASGCATLPSPRNKSDCTDDAAWCSRQPVLPLERGANRMSGPGDRASF